MAVQLDCEESRGCPSYFNWLAGKVIWKTVNGEHVPEESLTNTDLAVASGSNKITALDTTERGVNKITAFAAQGFGPYIRLLGYLYSCDFICGDDVRVSEDTIRATDAMELRRRFAEEVGAEKHKSERDIDRIWKSIHGKCSVLEFLVQLCIRMDAMVNEDGEPESMVPLFFCIMIGNMGLNVEETEAEWQVAIERFLGRTYAEDGSGGGLFPIENWVKGVSKDQREVPVWYQMNTWMREHLDEEEHFRVEDFSLKHCEQ